MVSASGLSIDYCNDVCHCNCIHVPCKGTLEGIRKVAKEKRELDLSHEETQKRSNFVKVSFYCPEEILELIREMTSNEGVTQSEFLRHTVIDGLSLRSERWNKIAVQSSFIKKKNSVKD